MKRHRLKYICAATILSACAFCGAMVKDADPLAAQDAIEVTLNNYLNGSSYNRPDQIKSAFYPESDMFLHHDDKPIYRMNSLTYADFFKKRERDIFNGRYGKILNIDVSGNIATAKAEILMPKINARFIDILILKKLDGDWKIISKAADRGSSDRSGSRMLLIANSDGQKFSDLITAYDMARAAGYTIEIANAEGKPITIRKINMNKVDNKAYLYDADFMFAMEHPIPFEKIKPENYTSAKYMTKRKPKGPAKALYEAICDRGNDEGEKTC